MKSFKLFHELNPEQQKQVEQIFFDTSAIKQFDSEELKNKFKYKYFAYYHEKYPELFLCILVDNIVQGYICGSPDSSKDLELFELLPHYKIFEDCFNDYPAHLHINMSPSSSGKGVGSQLINHFEELLKANQIFGVHLITGAQSRNVHFYQRNNYDFTLIRANGDHQLMLLAKRLNT